MAYLQKSVDEKISFQKDQMLYGFQVDLGMAFDSPLKEKVALEISGNSYIYSPDGQLSGKKQNKLEILQFFGWKTVVVNIGKAEINNILATMNDAAAQRLIPPIIQQIEAELKRPLARKPSAPSPK